MGLRQLDERLVPRLAERLRGLLYGTPPTRRRRSGPLRRLDDRFARRGPLAMVRDIPQLGVLVVATVILLGAGAAVAMTTPNAVRAREAAQAASSGPVALGPEVGSDAAGYLAGARRRAVELSRRDPDGRFLALVSLVRPLTPSQSAALLVGSQLVVERAYIRAPVESSTVRPVEVSGDVNSALNAEFAAAAQRRGDEQRALLKHADGLATTDPFRTTFESDARLAGLEAAAFRTPCGCVVALVISGRASELAELPALSAVRGVDLAASGARLQQLQIRPLLPADAAP